MASGALKGRRGTKGTPGHRDHRGRSSHLTLRRWHRKDPTPAITVSDGVSGQPPYWISRASPRILTQSLIVIFYRTYINKDLKLQQLHIVSGGNLKQTAYTSKQGEANDNTFDSAAIGQNTRKPENGRRSETITIRTPRRGDGGKQVEVQGTDSGRWLLSVSEELS